MRDAFVKVSFHVQHHLKGCLFHVFCEKMHNTFVFRWMETNEGDEIDVASVARRYHLISQKLFLSYRHPVLATKTWLEYEKFNGPSPITNQNNVFLFSQVRSIASMGTDLHRDQEGPDLRPKANLGGSRRQNGDHQSFYKKIYPSASCCTL